MNIQDVHTNHTGANTLLMLLVEQSVGVHFHSHLQPSVHLALYLQSKVIK